MGTQPLYLTYDSASESGWRRSIVGGKVFALRELMRSGVRVPAGVALPVELLRDCLETASTAEIREAIFNCGELSALVAACRSYRSHIESRPVPTELRLPIDAALQRLGGNRFAVRSSAVEEDGPRSSWAGQFDSFLDVSADRVSSMVISCWASLVSPRSVFYSRAVGVELSSVGMSVLIQKFVPARASGVAFTRHPVEKDGSVIYIEAVLGLGERLVAGRVIPDQYVVRKADGRVLSFTTPRGEVNARKRRSDETGGAAKSLPIARPVLNRHNLEEILAMCRIAEKRFGVPQDVEFAVWRGALYALQTRPITA